MPLRVPTVQTGLEASIQAAAKKAGRDLKINLGTSAKSIEGLSQPLGRITGKADQFTKSMEAANARVLAFGASVGVLSAVTQGFKDLVTTTIQVEKSLAQINTILGASGGQLDKFKKTIFEVARETEQSFDTVADAALELSRQGLKTEQVVSRLNDAMILSRLSGLGATEAVSGMTAALNSFSKSGVTSAEILNKLSAASVKAAVSERDLIEGLKRSASVANQAGVSLDELVGVITAVQQKTARGGAVIGNSFKTIFTRLQSIDKLETMQNLGVQITDVSGEILSGTELIQNLAKSIQSLPEARKLQIAENLVGKFQIAPFLAILDDYTSKTSIALRITETAANATNEAYNRNVALNKTLAAAINEATVNLKELANTLGEIGVTDSLKNILGFFNNLVVNIKDLLEGEGVGSDFARGIVKGISNVLSGPGLAIFGAIIAKLTIDLVRFGTVSLQTFFGLNKTAKDQAAIQGQIASTLLGNKGIQQQILAIENSTLSTEQKRAAQTKFFTTALNEQLAIMTRMQAIAARVAPGVLSGTSRIRGGRGAGGYIPNFNAVRGYGSEIPNFNAVRGYGQEKMDIARGVGGAPSSARPVAIPNFNFGGGQKGTMIANTSEVLVPNYAGGGSAIFNQDMIASMGMPSGGRAITGAQGYIPNFAAVSLNQTIRNMQAAGTLQGARVGTTDSYRIGDKVVYGSQVKKALASGGGNPQKRGELVVDASKYGVAAMFASKKTDTSFANIDTLTAPLAKVLKKRGVTGIRFQGIQVRDLENDFKTGLRKKSPHSPKKNRNLIAQLFANPLAQYGHKLIGSTFSNDEATKLSNAVTKVSKSSGGVNLFPSAVEGGIFEAAIRVVTKGARAIEEFKNHTTEQTPFDFEETGPASKQFMDTWQFVGSKGRMFRADAKRTATNEAVQTIISKALRGDKQYISTQATKAGFPTLSQLRKQRGGKTAASGYIPNFAISPLDMAVERERGAGLPINQIRINQDAGLRNARNPLGLAVTNTRDEPTGAIPSFAKAPKGAGGDMEDFKGGMSDAVGKLLLFTTVIQMASGMLGGLTGENEKVAASMKILNGAVIAASVAMMMPGGLGGVSKGIGAALSFGNPLARKFGASSLLRGGGNFGRSGQMFKGIGTAASRGMKTGGIVGAGLRGGGLAGKAAMTGLMGGLKVAGGALLRLAGPVGIVATGLILLKKGLDESSGANATVAKNAEDLALAAKNTSRELNSLKIPASLKEDIKEGAAERAKEFVATQKDARAAWWKGIGGAIKGGRDSQIWKDITSSIEMTAQQGVSEEAMQAAIDRLAERGGGKKKLDPEEDIDPFMAEMKALRERVNAQETINRVTTGLSAEDQDKFLELIALEDKAKSAGVAPGSRATSLRFGLEKQLRERALEERVNPDVVIAGAEQRFRSGFGQDRVQKDQKIDQVRSSIAKDRLKTALEISRIESQIASDVELQIAARKANKQTSEEQLFLDEQRLQRDALRKQEQEEQSKLIDAQVDKIKNLVTNKDSLQIIEDNINGLTLQQITSEENRLSIARSIASIDSDDADIINATLERMTKRGQLITKEFDAKKKVLSISQQQKKIEFEINQELENRKRDRATERLRDEGIEDLGFEARRQALQFAINAVDTQFGASEESKAAQKLGFEKALADLGVEEAEATAIRKFRDEVDQLEESGTLTAESIKEINKLVDEGGIEALGNGISKLRELLSGDAIDFGEIPTFEKIFEDVFNPKTGLTETIQTGVRRVPGVRGENKLDEKDKDLIEKAIVVGEQGVGRAGLAKVEADQEKLLLKRRKDNVGKFKSYLQLLGEFTKSLSAQAEQLKVNLLTTRDLRGEIITQLDTDKSRGLEGTPQGALSLAKITGETRFKEAKDQMFLARTRSESRQIERTLPMLLEEERIRQQIAEAQRNGTLNVEQLEAAERRLLEIEKERADVNETITAKMEDAFVFTQQEIRNQLTTELVTAATSFTNKISDGLVDAIAKGKNLGETLRMAAADFFLDMARANMRAAMSNLTSGIGSLFGAANSGGMITGGSGVRDDIPTMLTGGEFVMRRDAVSKYGVDFMSALNRGAIQTMAVGGLFTPGTYGQESIVGKDNLMRFATQSRTTGAQDVIRSGANFASVNLEPQSVRLTQYGIANTVASREEQKSKEDAFGLWKRQDEYERELERRAEEQKSALRGAILAAVVTAGIGFATKGLGRTPTPNPNQTGVLKAIPVDPSELSGAGGASRGGLGNIFTRMGESNNRLFNFWSRSYDAGQRFGQRLSIPGIDKRATGGEVPYAAGVDTVPTMLSGGEFVMNAAATERVGRGNLAALNSGAGGNNRDVVERLDELIDVSENGGESVINITVNSDGSTNQDGNVDEDQQALAVRIRDVVRQVIDEEKRLGGSLRQARA